MKIYTRTGDKGKTTLVGGTPVLKTHARIEAYGSVDEVIAHISLLRDMTGNADLKSYLLWIEERLMTCAAILAADCEDCPVKIPELRNADVESLEKELKREIKFECEGWDSNTRIPTKIGPQPIAFDQAGLLNI
jgi:cob(I)alamin adenosyltransferase